LCLCRTRPQVNAFPFQATNVTQPHTGTCRRHHKRINERGRPHRLKQRLKLDRREGLSVNRTAVTVAPLAVYADIERVHRALRKETPKMPVDKRAKFCYAYLD